MGRPRKRIRPLVCLSEVYVARVGAECQESFQFVSDAAGRAVSPADQRELAIVAERLAKLAEMLR